MDEEFIDRTKGKVKVAKSMAKNRINTLLSQQMKVEKEKQLQKQMEQMEEFGIF